MLQAKPLALSRPGKYTTWFTVQTVHQAGVQSLPRTQEYHYIAECGDVVSCQLHPEHQAPEQPFKLHSQLPSMMVQLLDDHGNMYGGSGTRLPVISFECPKLHVKPVAGQSACWESPVHDAHWLKLPQLVITPKAADGRLNFEHPDRPVNCTITVVFSNLSEHRSPTARVSISFDVKIVPGN